VSIKLGTGHGDVANLLVAKGAVNTRRSDDMAAAVSSIRVTNVKFGVLDQKKKIVYPGTTVVNYQENGRCVIGSSANCMWYGLSFDYHGIKEGEDVICHVHFSQRPHSTANSHAGDKEIFDATIPLELNPDKSSYLGDYSIRKEAGDSGLFISDFDCKYHGNSVINGIFTVDLGSN
jgi:hypothetical protein